MGQDLNKMTDVLPDLTLVRLLLAKAAGENVTGDLERYSQAQCRRYTIVLAERAYLSIDSPVADRGPFGYARNSRIVGITTEGVRLLDQLRNDAPRSTVSDEETATTHAVRQPCNHTMGDVAVTTRSVAARTTPVVRVKTMVTGIMSRAHFIVPWWTARTLCVALMVAATPAVAQDDAATPSISTDRPGQATTPSVLLPGHVQAEIGFQMASDKTGDEPTTIESTTLSVPGALVRIGVLSSMELRLGAEYRSVTTMFSDSDRTTSGVASLSIGTKVHVTAENGALPEAAIVTSFVLPAGSEDFRPASVAPTMLLATRTTLSSTANLYCTVGGSWDGAVGEGTAFYAALLGASLSGNLSGSAELYGSFPPGLPPVHAFDAGCAYVLAQNLQFDLFGGAAITSNATDYFANVGVSVRLPR